MITRRQFLRISAGAAGVALAEPWAASGAGAIVRPAAATLPNGASAPFDHVVVLMMENRSFDHFLGWLPGANGRQAGLAYTDRSGTTYPTYDLAPDWQGCGYDDPDHSWEGGVTQLAGGTASGFLKTAVAGDTFPIGYYTQASIPVLGALAEQYTTSDNYFAAILAETYPNRFYQHSAQTDRDHNSTATATMPTIWDRLAAAGLSGRYYSTDLPFLALWGSKYAPIINQFPQFLTDCAAGNLPNVAFVDPAFNGEGQGLSRDDHPHADIRSGEAFISEVYEALRSSPAWSKTVLVINYDEWGGFFDHVVPPRVVDTHVNPAPGPHPDYHQLGFRVPLVVASPFSAKGRIVSGGAPFEHTSVLKMIEWRWNLPPLTARDANARNLAEVLDLSLRRNDTPVIPTATYPPPVACGAGSAPAHKPAALSSAGGGQASPPPSRHPGGNGSAAGTNGQSLPATGAPAGLALAGATAMVAGLAIRRVGSPNTER